MAFLGISILDMRFPSLLALLLILIPSAPALALYEGLQCVPYARSLTGISIYGDAWTWWGQADGRYARGNKPKPGAVLAFKAHGAMKLGHVAAVRKIVDSRTLLISHANWSRIDGIRGHVEENVKVIDTSAANDWSQVRVHFAALGDLGTTHYPVHGFIYPTAAKGKGDSFVSAPKTQATKQAIGQAKVAKVDESATAVKNKPKPQTGKSGSFTMSSSVLAEIDRTVVTERKKAGQQR